MTIEYLNINLSGKTAWAIFFLLAISLNSCSVVRTKKNKQFERLIEEQLGIKKIHNGKDTTYSNINLINGDKIRLNQGHNFINNPFTGEKLEIFIKVKNGKVHKIEKIDTLITNNKIVREEWIIEENGGELNFTTTDFQGRLIHFYGQVFNPGQSYGNYTDTSVDSLGNAYTEWGVTEETAGTRRKN